MKSRHFRVAAIAAVGTGALATAAIANHAWSTYHWAGNGSNLTLKVNKAVTSQWTAYVDEAISDWDQSNELTLNPQNASVNARKCNPIAGQILACNAAYGNRGWLGIANIWLSNGHISQATTKLNDTYFTQAYYNKPEWRRMVACQEIGHDFGLTHVDENFDNANQGTCMDYTSNPLGPPTNEHPNSHDYAQLTSIYNHDDGFTSSTAATDFGIRAVGQRPPLPPQAEAALGDTPADWGRAVHNDSRGRPDLFEKQLGPGRKVLTHVFWALDVKPKDIR